MVGIHDLEQRSMGVLGFGALLTLGGWGLKGKARIFALAGGAQLLAYFVTGAVYFFWYMALPICSAIRIRWLNICISSSSR